jgi:hypothetical protein
MSQKPSDSWFDLFPTGQFMTSTLSGGASVDNYMQTAGQMRVALNNMLKIPRPEESRVYKPVPVHQKFVSAPLREIVAREQAQAEADRANPIAFVRRAFGECEVMCRMPWEGQPATISERFQPID